MNIFSFKLSGLAFAALLAGSAAGLGSPAQAAGPVGATAAVHHADLNLASTAGVKRLQARIRNAAEQLCLSAGVASIQQKAEGKACIAATVDAAQPQVRLAIARHGEQQYAAVRVDSVSY